MLLFIARRFFQSILVMIVVAALAFVMFTFIGDPVNQMVGIETTPEQRADLRERLGLNDPVYLQFGRFIFAAAQFESEAAFAGAAGEAALLGAPMHLTLNAPMYDPAAQDDLLSLAERAATWGVKGLIVGDPGLLMRLRDADLGLEVTLSTLAGFMNRQSLAFYKRFGLHRAVLPRHLTLAEMASIAQSDPELEFEAFILVGKCPNEEAHCSFQHTSESKRWPCEIPYHLSDKEGKPLLEYHPMVGYQERWSEADRRCGCGLCGIPLLAEAGIKWLKLVGRGGPTPGKVANVELVRRFIEKGSEGWDQAEALAAYKERFGRACDPLGCYFPELHPQNK